MDENADLRLTIETARKNKNWARRCYAYELAMEYFSLLEPDCYELCSYCDSIPEFLEEKNECCLTRALGAVKVFVNKCVDAPSIAREVTRVIIDKIFFSASTKIREIATDIILDFIEWEACNAVLKELITGALKYDGVRCDECIRVMRYALLDFGPHVISIYKLIDFIAVLVRNKSFLSIDDECSQLLIVIYKCLGPQVRVHLTQILDPDYISAIEESYEEMRNIPIYHCRFVRYSNDNSSSLRESDEEVFAACIIAEPTSHPTNYGNEEMLAEGEGMAQEADQSRFSDFGREPYYRVGDAGPSVNENKGYWDPQRFDNVANYQLDYVAGGANQQQRIQVRLNAYDNAIAFDAFDHSNRADSFPELFRHVPGVLPEPEQQDYQWNPNNFEQSNDYPRSVSTVDQECQTDGCSLQSTNPFEFIMQKLMDKYGTEDILYWLCLKLNSSTKTPLNVEGTKESRKVHLSRNCKSLETLAMCRKQTHNKARSSISNTTARLCFHDRVTTCSYLNNTKESSFYSKLVINMNEEKKSMGKKGFASKEKNTAKSHQVLQKENENMTAEPVIPFECTILSQEYLKRNIIQETKENVSDLVKIKSQVHVTKRSLAHKFFQKIPFSSSKKKKTTRNTSEDSKTFIKNFQLVFKGRGSPRKYNGQNPFYPYLNDNQQTNYFHQETPIDLPANKENSGSYFDKYTNTCRNSYSINRSTNFSAQRTVFSNGWQTRLNHNQIPEGFFSRPEELQHNACRGDDLQSSSNKVEENVDEMCLSESDSITEISPNLCCYCFQKNSIRRMSKKREASSKSDDKTFEKDKVEEGNLRGHSCIQGSDDRRVRLERTDENTPFNLTTEGNLFGVISLRHRGSGDELSQPAIDRQQVPEESVREEESQRAQRGQTLFCCISMNDANEQASQFGS